MKFSKVFILSVILILFAIPVVAQTNAAGNATHCSLATLKGSYALDEGGSIVVVSPPLLFVTTGIILYDGNGKISGSETTSLNGAPMPGTFTGTYTVNSDCTYSDSVVVSPSGALLNHKGIIFGDGISREVNVIGIDLGVVSSATIRKTPPGGCSLTTIKGTYGFREQGTITVQLPGFPAPPVPFVGVGTITYDGNGNASGSFTTNISGQSISSTATGTYTVSAACEYTDQLTSSSGLASSDAGAITGVGIFQEVHYINSGGGFVSGGTAKK